MGWGNDQVVPSHGIVDAVVDRAVQPAIAGAVGEAGGFAVRAMVSVWQYDNKASERGIITCGSNAGDVNAEVRVRFRETVKPGRFLFFAQLRLKAPEAMSKLAGVFVKGDVKCLASDIIVTATSRTSVFNQMEWVDPGGR